MKKIIFILISIFISSSIYANPLQFFWQNKNDHWKLEDTILQTTFIVFMIIDWRQTIWISNNPNIPTKIYNKETEHIYTISTTTHKESNPILGNYPSKNKIAIYFLSTTILHTIITYILPRPYKNIFQMTGIIIEIYATTNNYNSGVKIHF